MKHIVLFLILCAAFSSCNNSKTEQKELQHKEKPTVKKSHAKEKPKKQIFKTEEIGKNELIIGEWKIVDIGGKAVPEDRKDITATFKPDGAFERRLSPAHKADTGNWSIELVDSIKMLKLNTVSGMEENQLIKLSKEELVFISFRKPVRLRKVK